MSDGTHSFAYTYLANSNLIETVTGPAHTVTNIYATDRDVLLSKENKVGGTTVSKYAYTVNAIGQRSSVSQTGSVFASGTGWNWGYDSLGQVISAEHATTPANHRAYQYDAINNRIEVREGVTAVTGTPNYTTNNLNQYTSVGTVSPLHDDDGNMTSGQIPTGSAGLVWDAENRLIAANITGGDTVHYFYDSQSRRIARTVGTDSTLYVYDSWNVIAEYQNNNLTKTHLWGTDLSGSAQGAGGVGGLLSVTSHAATGNETHFPTYDGNGNVSEYLDTTATIAAHFEYDPFGNTVVNTDTANQFPYRFSTKPIDTTTGLYYYGYRFYDPVTGRWPSRDPIEERGGVNLYGFVGNEGVNKIDPLGLNHWAWPLAIVEIAEEIASLSLSQIPEKYKCEEPCKSACAVAVSVGSASIVAASASGLYSCGSLRHPWAVGICATAVQTQKILSLSNLSNDFDNCIQNCDVKPTVEEPDCCKE